MKHRLATADERQGSSLQGHIHASYSELVHLFGEPGIEDGPKVSASWNLMFDDGTYASIYLWKMAEIPVGRHDWSVGGHNTAAVDRVRATLETLADNSEKRTPPKTTSNSAWTKHDLALGRACAAGDVLAAQFFLEVGADINARSPEIDGGNVALEAAIENGHYQVVEMLLAAGADVNSKRPGGQVPLHRAAILGEKKLIQLLLDSGADTEAADYAGTAADWARRFNRDEIAEFIESQRAAE